MATRAVVKKVTPLETIERLIMVLRGHRVMLDHDLAELYGVPVKRLNEQVKRNRERFPEDFMFQLTLEEGEAARSSRSQIATMKQGGNLKYRPYAFTEHGAVMLANVLRSQVAVRSSIQVVRAFINLRRVLAANETLLRKVESIEQRVDGHDSELQDVLRVLRKLLEPAAASEETSDRLLYWRGARCSRPLEWQSELAWAFPLTDMVMLLRRLPPRSMLMLRRCR